MGREVGGVCGEGLLASFGASIHCIMRLQRAGENQREGEEKKKRHSKKKRKGAKKRKKEKKRKFF